MQAEGLQSGEDKGIDRIRLAAGEGGGGLSGGHGGLERPVRLVGRSLFDPAFEDRFLSVGKRFVAFGWRHDVVFHGGDDALPHFTGGGVTGFDGEASVFVWHQGSAVAVGYVEPQASFAGFGIKAVTGKTCIGQNRPDVAVELDDGVTGAGGRRRCGGQGGGQGRNQ